MFGIGTQELIIILIIVLILFGTRLPSVMRSLGRGVVEFKKGMQGIDDETGDSNRAKIEQKEEPSSKTTSSQA
jgi:sec-independent protein translocase protein TatA